MENICNNLCKVLSLFVKADADVQKGRKRLTGYTLYTPIHYIVYSQTCLTVPSPARPGNKDIYDQNLSFFER